MVITPHRERHHAVITPDENVRKTPYFSSTHLSDYNILFEDMQLEDDFLGRWTVLRFYGATAESYVCFTDVFYSQNDPIGVMI